MPEQEVAALNSAEETTSQVAPPTLNEVSPPTETALTRTEVAELIAAATADVQTRLKSDIDAAHKLARRGENKGDTANFKLAKMEAILESIALRGMDESEARLWKAERAVERANETTTQVSAQQEYEQAASAFQQKSAAYLSSEGIDSKDERLTTAFTKYAAEAKTYNDWDTALLRAVADVHKAKAAQAAQDVKTVADKAREEERAKLRNENKAASGAVDKGNPASTGKIDWKTISDAEFAEIDAQATADRLRRQRQIR